MEVIQPTQDAVQVEDTTEKFEQSIPSAERNMVIPQKRLIEAESPAQDDEQLTDSIDKDMVAKRPRISGCEDNAVCAETRPPPVAPKIQGTPQKNTSAAKSPEIEESPVERYPKSLPAPEHDSAPIVDESKDDGSVWSSTAPHYSRTPTPASATMAHNEREGDIRAEAAQSEPLQDSTTDGESAHNNSVADNHRGSVIATAIGSSYTAPETTIMSLSDESVGGTFHSPSSPLTSPPSSPTLDAQAESIEVPALMDSQETSRPPAARQKAIETVDKGNVEPILPADPSTSSNRTDAEQRDVSMQDSPPAEDENTPASSPAEPLLTLPSSVVSQTGSAELVKTSGRARKKPQRHGTPDQSFATLEEVGLDAVPEDDVDLAAPVSKQKTSTRTKGDKTPVSKAKSASPVLKKTPAESNARVAKPRKYIYLTKMATTRAPTNSKPATQKRCAKATKQDATPAKTLTATKATKALTTPKAPKASRKKNLMDEPSISILAADTSLTFTVDARKRSISENMCWRADIDLKPTPIGGPRVWAENRQSLCETLPYFKKPRGGCYSNDGHVYGFLFDGVGHCREYLDENLILCRAGGSMEADGATGGMAQKKDQLMTDAQVQSVINDMKHRNPVIVICGSKNVAAPTKMPHQYNVLGWFKQVYVWAEKTEGKGKKVRTTIKYRLERLNQHLEPAWYSPDINGSQTSADDEAIAGPLVTASCKFCHTTSPQIYLQGWWCVNPACDAFWEIDTVPVPCGKGKLDYDPAFLLHRYELWKNDDEEREPEPMDVRPSVPKVGEVIGDHLYYINTRGVCCPYCGRCNSRRKFSGWKCENPVCNWSLTPERKPVLPTMLHTPWDAAPTLVRNRLADGVHVESMHMHGYKILRYTFDGINGCFVHIAATKQVLSEKNGPNDMFADLQTIDMGLERRVFAFSKTSGGKPKENLPDPATQEDGVPAQDNVDEAIEEFAAGDLMTAFSMNYGMPYKFVASGGSQSFESAPSAVIECRRRLNWAQRTFLNNQNEYMDFNEELIFAYLEGQKIEYHDDGESGLGPRIATLSLGGRAKMHMRMKLKHFVGCTKAGLLTEDRPIPGGIDGVEMDRKRMEKWEELQKLKGDSVTYNKRRKEIPKELGIFEKKMKKAADLVTVTLSHGDMIIMDGYDIQKYLEHKVVPEGYLRFALTCRTVLPDHLKPEELPADQVKEDPIKYNGPDLASLAAK
jgi:hypothetical protein